MITRFISFPTLKTPRLTLRQIKVSDQGQIFKIRSDLMVNQYLDRTPATNSEDAAAHILKLDRLYNTGEAINWAINLHENELFMGSLCFWDYNQEKEHIEIGYSLLPEYQGQGYCTEAMKTCLTFAFDTMQVKSIGGEVHKENAASIHLLRKFGFIAIDECEWNTDFMNYRLIKENSII